MSNDDIFEDNVVLIFELNADGCALIADNIDFFFDVSLLNDDTWLSDWVFARIDSLNQVNRGKGLHLLKSFFKRPIWAILRIYNSSPPFFAILKSFLHDLLISLILKVLNDDLFHSFIVSHFLQIGLEHLIVQLIALD